MAELTDKQRLERAEWGHSWAKHLEGSRLPYVFGGGHGVKGGLQPNGKEEIPPTRGTNPAIHPIPGYDCSGVASAVFWHAGMLGHQEALSTQEFEDKWGYEKKGAHWTLWIINKPSFEHCLIEFTLPNKKPEFFAARHEGTYVGFYPPREVGPWLTEGYVPRHPA